MRLDLDGLAGASREALMSEWREVDVSRFRAAPGSHLGCYTFKSQGAFPA